MGVEGHLTAHPIWVVNDADSCVSSVSDVSAAKKQEREHRASCDTKSNTDSGCNDDADASKQPKVFGEKTRDTKLRSTSPLWKEIDISPLDCTSAIATAARSTDRSPTHHAQSSSMHGYEKDPSRLVHRRTSVETPRIHSRRASIGGTTLYQTSHMAKIDAFLRGSDLRLKKNGTCSFIFAEKKFEIETTAETKEFMFYCSLGPLTQWKKVWAKQMIHMMALWNEEQITKTARGGNDDDSKFSHEMEGETEGDAGLLRIDSSKQNSVVAFILYGHVDNIKDEISFVDKLDEFVDDALHFHDKLKAGPELEKDADDELKRHHKSPSSNTSTITACLTNSLTSSEPDGDNTASTIRRKRPDPSLEEANTPPSHSNNASPDQDDHTSGKKSGVFAKMIKSIRSKYKEDIGKHAFVDPNQNSAFVVDTSAAECLKIQISRQSNSSPVTDTNNVQPRSRRGSAYTEGRGSAIDDGHRALPKRDSSITVDDRHRRPSRKSTSFLHDDYSGGMYYPVTKGASYHVEEKKASSFHIPNRHRRSHSDRRISSPDTLNAIVGVDKLNLDLSDKDRCRSSRYNQSEPVLVQNRNEAASPSSKDYRRHLTSDHHRNSRSSSRPRRVRTSIVYPEQSSGGGGKEQDRGNNRSSRSKSQVRAPPAPPLRPPEIGRSRSRSAIRSKSVRGRSRSSLVA